VTGLWAIVFFGHCFEITEEAKNSEPLFSTNQVLYSIWQNMAWAKFWAIFYRTHLVTLFTKIIHLKHF
jgi:hypothetical protein